MLKTKTLFHPINLIPWLCVVAILVLNASRASALDPASRPDNSWISISGSVKDVATNSFNLDFGDGVIMVEMDDGDRDAKGYQLLPGDKVTVTGKIDDDFFEKASIKASSVYLEKLGTYFFAAKADKGSLYVIEKIPVIVADTVVQGVVTEVEDHEFKLDTAVRTLTVDVGKMPYNPLDDEGYLKIRPGNVVRVTGRIDKGLFLGRELIANHVTKILE